MDDQNKNLILATALSFLVILGWFWMFPPQDVVPPQAEQPVVGENATPGTPPTGGDVASTPAAQGAAATPATIAATQAETRDAALAKSDRIQIKTPRVSGSLSLVGGRIDDLQLLDYNVRLNDPSEKVILLSPAGGPKAYYTLYGWAPAGDLPYSDVPGPQTEWSLYSDSDAELTQATPLTLKWDNGKGLVFFRKIGIDENYMFTVTQSVENNTGKTVRMAPYGIVARKGEPDVIGFYILHEGVVRASDGELQEIKYKKMPDQDYSETERANVDVKKVEENGWIAFTDKYWMTALVPKPGQKFTSVSKYTPANDTYQIDMRLPTMDIPAGETTEISTMLFAGAKEWATIKDYETRLGVQKFIDSIDWGMFFFITKPMFAVLHFLKGIIGNMGWAIIGLTIVIKALLFPLAYKSYVSMARMKELQPELEKLKEQCGDDRQRLQKEMMALYKKKKANPAAGCLPIFLQIPIFFSLYKVIFVTIELRHAPWIGWIQDLSARDPSSILNLFGLLPWDAPDPTSFLYTFSIGILPILMGITMWLQQKLNPTPADKTQATIFAWMPWVFMFMLGRFASGLVLYWITNNTITFTQQYLIMRSQGVKPDVFGNIKKGFAKFGKPKT